eukprot:COSAG01_NODE_10_length_42970_cov_93.010007_27_plen_76_part_00
MGGIKGRGTCYLKELRSLELSRPVDNHHTVVGLKPGCFSGDELDGGWFGGHYARARQRLLRRAVRRPLRPATCSI